MIRYSVKSSSNILRLQSLAKPGGHHLLQPQVACFSAQS